MSWAALFERAGDHGTTAETISKTLAAIRAKRERERSGEGTGDNGGTDDA